MKKQAATAGSDSDSPVAACSVKVEPYGSVHFKGHDTAFIYVVVAAHGEPVRGSVQVLAHYLPVSLDRISLI